VEGPTGSRHSGPYADKSMSCGKFRKVVFAYYLSGVSHIVVVRSGATQGNSPAQRAGTRNGRVAVSPTP
jgi:hypothetical protein